MNKYNPNIHHGRSIRLIGSLVANGCLGIFKTKNETMGKLWQRNYHEHIIRNDKSYNIISEYIVNNAANWTNNKLHKMTSDILI